MQEIRAKLDNLQPQQVHMVIGAWTAGMGLVLFLMGLNLWITATCDEHCCRREETK